MARALGKTLGAVVGGQGWSPGPGAQAEGAGWAGTSPSPLQRQRQGTCPSPSKWRDGWVKALNRAVELAGGL